MAPINSGFNCYQRIPLWCLILSLEKTNTVLIANKLILPAKSEGPLIFLLVQWLQKYCPSLIGFLTFLAQTLYDIQRTEYTAHTQCFYACLCSRIDSEALIDHLLFFFRTISPQHTLASRRPRNRARVCRNINEKTS